MNKEELCNLFGIYSQELETCLDRTLSSKVIRVEDVCRYHQYVTGSKICYDIAEVNLEFIITLAFQIDSPQAIVVRRWFVKQWLSSQQLKFSFMSTEQDYVWN